MTIYKISANKLLHEWMLLLDMDVIVGKLLAFDVKLLQMFYHYWKIVITELLVDCSSKRVAGFWFSAYRFDG